MKPCKGRWSRTNSRGQQNQILQISTPLYDLRLQHSHRRWIKKPQQFTGSEKKLLFRNPHPETPAFASEEGSALEKEQK